MTRRVGEGGWLIFLAVLPFVHLVVILTALQFSPNLPGMPDPWYWQATWAQAWAILLWMVGLATGQRAVRPNLGLAVWLGWVGLWSLYSWSRIVVQTHSYAASMLQALVHLLLAYWLYQSAMTVWTTGFLSRLLRVMAWAGVGIVAYGVLQWLQLDQFFKNLDPHLATTDQAVGTMGNASHYAAHLSLLLPLFFLQRGVGWKLLAGLTGVLVWQTDSQAAQLALFVVVAWQLFAWDRLTGWVSLLATLGGAGYVLTHLGRFAGADHGRWAAWQQLWAVYRNQPITGLGAGFLMEFSKTIPNAGHPLSTWRHAHNEPLQALMEYGVVGVVGLAMMLWTSVREAWALPKTPVAVALIGLGLAFCVNSLLNFSAHLWVTGSYGLVAYAGLRVLAQEQAA